MDAPTHIEPVIKKDPFDGTTTMVMAITSSPSIEILLSQHFKVPYVRGGREQALSILPYTITDKYGNSKGGLNLSTPLLSADSTMSILFDDESIISKELTSKSDGSYDWELTDEDCSCFLFKKIRMIRISNTAKDFDFSFEGDDLLYIGLPELFQQLIEKFLEAAAKTAKWSPMAAISKPQSNKTQADTNPGSFEDQAEYCYVYLMNDTSNGYYNIGMSNNPEYRESTLQSEKPTIVKVCQKKYPSRRIARSIEAALHKVFEDKRVRGEWFSLKDKDIWEIKQTLS